MDIWREFTFEAAHRLPNVPEGHKCARLHGHSYRVKVTITGPVGEHTGWVMDFGAVAAATEPLRARLDHACLNEVPGLRNPTSENLACWLWARLSASLPLAEVTVQETSSSGCTYRGERNRKEEHDGTGT
jgi:6-pyruvoyltetrahydropterin/6-carboxytetrahydropterin synthase